MRAANLADSVVAERGVVSAETVSQQAERRRNVACDIDYECIGEPLLEQADRHFDGTVNLAGLAALARTDRGE
jgi:hypothetical protein